MVLQTGQLELGTEAVLAPKMQELGAASSKRAQKARWLLLIGFCVDHANDVLIFLCMRVSDRA